MIKMKALPTVVMRLHLLLINFKHTRNMCIMDKYILSGKIARM